MITNFPNSFTDDLAESEVGADPSLLRLARDAGSAISNDIEFEQVKVQGLGELIRNTFKEAILIAHEFLCTESERFEDARTAFGTMVDTAIAACAAVLKQKVPAVEGYEAYIFQAFKLAYRAGTDTFCKYVSVKV